jgi:hypothetical protein
LGATGCEDLMWNGCLTKLESLLNASMVTTLFTRSAGADRWFAEYEPGADQYGEHGQLTGNIQGFETREEARRDCEENASVMAKALSS